MSLMVTQKDREAILEDMEEATPKETLDEAVYICETLRQVYLRTQEPETRSLILKAYVQAKRMNKALWERK